MDILVDSNNNRNIFPNTLFTTFSLLSSFYDNFCFFFSISLQGLYTIFSKQHRSQISLLDSSLSPFMCEPSSATPHLLLSFAIPHPLRAAQDIIRKFISSSASLSRLHGNSGTESLENL